MKSKLDLCLDPDLDLKSNLDTTTRQIPLFCVFYLGYYFWLRDTILSEDKNMLFFS